MITCDVCGPQVYSAFSEAARSHVSHKGQRTLCNDCSNPPCSAIDCKTCKVCRNVECKKGGACKDDIVALNSKQLVKSLEEKARFLCDACCEIQCDLCGLCPRTAFSSSALNNRSHAGQRTLCKDCTHPQCTAPNCTTCRVCRSTSCKKGKKCKGDIACDLHAKQLVKTLEEKSRFKCDNCQCPPCSDCKAPMPHGSRGRFRKSGSSEWICSICRKYPRCTTCSAPMPKNYRKAFEKSGNKTYTCGDCRSLKLGRETRQRHT